MNKIRIPTLLAITFLIIGIAVGVLLVERNQIFRLGADTQSKPKDIRVSNINDVSFTVSWITDKETRGFVVWGDSPQNLKRIMEETSQNPGFVHYVKVSGVSPNKSYFFKINSDHTDYDSNGIPWRVNTAANLPLKPTANVMAGTVVTKTGIPVGNTLIYAVASGGSLLSTITTPNGSWTLDISATRNQKLDSYIPIEKDTLIELSVQAGPLGIASAQVYLANAKPVPPIELGRSHDYKNLESTQKLTVPTAEINMPTSQVNTSEEQALNSANPANVNNVTKVINTTKTNSQSLTKPIFLSIISLASVVFGAMVFYFSLEKEQVKLKHARR